MMYLFAFADEAICKRIARQLRAKGIACEVLNAREFPDVTQGPELSVRDDEDYDMAMLSIQESQREQ